MADVIRHLGVSDVTHYLWRKEYGDLKVDHACGSGQSTRTMSEPMTSSWIEHMMKRRSACRHSSSNPEAHGVRPSSNRSRIDCRSNGYNESFNGKLRDERHNGDFLLAERAQNTYRTMALALQYGATSLFTRLPPTSTANEIALPNPSAKHDTVTGCAIGGGNFPLTISSFCLTLFIRNVIGISVQLNHASVLEFLLEEKFVRFSCLLVSPRL